MFALWQTVFVCFLLLAISQLTDGLTCYASVTPDGPFNSDGMPQITVADNKTYSCAKYWAASGMVIRYALITCPSNNVVGVGVFCCTTNLCNDTSKMIPTGSLLLSLGLVVIIMLL